MFSKFDRIKTGTNKYLHPPFVLFDCRHKACCVWGISCLARSVRVDWFAKRVLKQAVSLSEHCERPASLHCNNANILQQCKNCR